MASLISHFSRIGHRKTSKTSKLTVSNTTEKPIPGSLIGQTDTSLLVIDTTRGVRMHERFSPVHMSKPQPDVSSDVLDLTPKWPPAKGNIRAI